MVQFVDGELSTEHFPKEHKLAITKASDSTAEMLILLISMVNGKTIKARKSISLLDKCFKRVFEVF